MGLERVLNRCGVVGRLLGLLIVLLALNPLRATTLTGTLKNPDGSGANGFLLMSLSQQAALLSTGGCGGPAEVVPTVQLRFQVSNGNFTSTPTVYGNDCMLPQGTYYNVTVVDNNGNTLFNDRWVIQGTTIDVGTIVSVSIAGTTGTIGGGGVVLTTPLTNQTVNQPIGTVLSINRLVATGAFTFPQGAVCDGAGCNGMTFKTGVLMSGGFQTIPGTNSLLYVGNGGQFINRTWSGFDAFCSGVTDGFQGVRLDTKVLEFCIGGTEYGVQLPNMGGGGGGSGAPNVSATSTPAVTSLAINTTTLNVASTQSMLVQCWTGTGPYTQVAITNIASTIVGGIVTNVTASFASTGNVYCTVNSNGGAGPAGATGPAGSAGAGYSPATSTTSLSIGTGSHTFTTQSGLAYQAGARARATSTGTGAYMEGVVSSYSGTTLIINIDNTSGSGAHSDWNINIAGDPGMGGGGAVSSVFTRTGAVTAQTGDYTAAQVTNAFDKSTTNSLGANAETFTDIATPSNPAAGQTKFYSKGGLLCSLSSGGSENCTGSGGGAVTSVFTRTGAVTAQTGDYLASQVTNAVDKTTSNTYNAGAKQIFQPSASTAGERVVAGALPSTPATGDLAIDSGDSNKLKWWDGSAWQSALAPAAPVTSVFTRTGAVTAQTGDYTAAQVTNAADKTASNTYTAGAKQVFQPSASTAAARVVAGALPSTPATGDLAVDSGDSNKLKVWNGSAWITAGPDAVTSVFSRTGVVTAQTGDYTAAQVTNAADLTAALNTFCAGCKVQVQPSASTAGFRVAAANLPSTPLTGDIAVDLSDSNKLKYWNGSAWITTGPDAVSSVFTRTGAVTAQTGDYTAAQVTNAFDLTANNALGAHAETFTDIATPANPSAGQTKIYSKGGLICSLNSSGSENCTGSGGGTVTSVFTRTGAVTAQTGDYTAAQVTNAFDLTANNSLGAHSQTSTDIATPAAPASGSTKFYSKGGKLCSEDPSGNEFCTGLPVGVVSVSPTFGGTTTLDLSLGNVFNLGTLTGNTTIAVSNQKSGMAFYMLQCQDATGGRSYTYPATFKNVPALAPDASQCQLIGPIAYDNSTSYYVPGTNIQGLMALGATGTACAANPASGSLCVSLDTASNNLRVRDSSGNLYYSVKDLDCTGTGHVLKSTGGVLNCSADAVTSVFGRTGAVTAQTGDYTAAQVTNAFDRSTGNALGANAETFTDIATPANPSAGQTKFYSKAGKLCSLDSSGNENCTGTGGGAVSSVFTRTGAVTAQTGDYTAAQVTNAFDLTANNNLGAHSQTMTDIATPTAPGAGATKIYSKGGKICSLDPSSNENCTGGGTGVASVGYSGTFTNSTFTVLQTTHLQGAHPQLAIWDSTGTAVYPAYHCLTAGAAAIGCGDSTSVGDMVIGPFAASGTYTFLISAGGSGQGTITRSVGATFFSSSALTTQVYCCVVTPAGGTIRSWDIIVDDGTGSGTCASCTATIKFWRVASGTATPTSANAINSAGVALSTGTAIHSTTTTDFSLGAGTAVTANDIYAVQLFNVANAKVVMSKFNYQ